MKHKQLCVYCLFDYLRREEFTQRMRTAQMRKRANEMTAAANFLR